jgi:hypothetical protein
VLLERSVESVSVAGPDGVQECGVPVGDPVQALCGSAEAMELYAHPPLDASPDLAGLRRPGGVDQRAVESDIGFGDSAEILSVGGEVHLGDYLVQLITELPSAGFDCAVERSGGSTTWPGELAME